MNLQMDQNMSEPEALQLNPLQLAYIGDAVWEILVRDEMVRRRYNVHHMHQACIKRVSAQGQAAALELLMPYLLDSEVEIVRRGRNSHPHHPSPRNQHPDDYAAATGLEALIGFLYLTGRHERIHSLFQQSTGETTYG